MALLLKEKTEYGIEADYWKIIIITVDNRNKAAQAKIGLFLNKDAASESKPVRTLVVDIKDDKFKSFVENGGNVGAMYTILKEVSQSPFKEAKDA